jgi:hypothetical protein
MDFRLMFGLLLSIGCGAHTGGGLSARVRDSLALGWDAPLSSNETAVDFFFYGNTTFIDIFLLAFTARGCAAIFD